MWYLVFIAVIVLLLAVICAMYAQASRVLSGVERMLDGAADGTFTETEFTEKRLSRLESKMQRFLSARSVSLAKSDAEKMKSRRLFRISRTRRKRRSPIFCCTRSFCARRRI